MPEVIVPIVSFLVGNAGWVVPLATTGIGLGMKLAGVGMPSTSAIPATATSPAPSQGGDMQAKISAIARQFPSLQEQTGGALAPEALMQAAGFTAGVPGEPLLSMQALNQWMGTPDLTSLMAGTGASTTSGGSGIAPRASPSLSMFPNEAVPAYAGLSGGST